jgi:hypothetical protein
MQAASTEAPAFHTGDRSIYDSSRVLETTTRVATMSQPTYEPRSAPTDRNGAPIKSFRSGRLNCGGTVSPLAPPPGAPVLDGAENCPASRLVERSPARDLVEAAQAADAKRAGRVDAADTDAG